MVLSSLSLDFLISWLLRNLVLSAGCVSTWICWAGGLVNLVLQFWMRESQDDVSLGLKQQLQSLLLICTVLSDWFWAETVLNCVTLKGAVSWWALVLVFQLATLKQLKKAEEQKLSEFQQRLEQLEPIKEKVKGITQQLNMNWSAIIARLRLPMSRITTTWGPEYEREGRRTLRCFQQTWTGPMMRPSPHFTWISVMLCPFFMLLELEELMTWLWTSKVLAWLDIFIVVLWPSAKSFATLDQSPA